MTSAGSPAGRLLLAAAAGQLYALGHVGFGIWPLAFVALLPWWRAIEGLKWRGAAGLGLLFGLSAYAIGYPWLLRLVEVFLDGGIALGLLLWLGYGVWFASGFAVVAVAFRAGGAAGSVAALVLVEWLQPQLFSAPTGATLIHAPVLAQSADLGGPLLLSAFVLGVNALLYEAWRRADPRPLGIAVGVFALAVGYGFLRERAIEADAPDETLRVGIVQANLGLEEKREQAAEGHARHLAMTRELLAEGPLDLVVWPETAYGRALRRPLPVDGQPIRMDIDVPLLFGGTAVTQGKDGRRASANAAFLIGEDGRITDAYDKNLLIPIAETPPLAGLVPGLADWFPRAQRFQAATETPPLHLGDVRIATPICYEVIEAGFVRRMVGDADPHLLVTIANDAWFGDTQEPHLHLNLARLRAIEHRRWLVRATNSGISAFVDPTGRVTGRTELLTRETLRGEVAARRGSTAYTRFGDWPLVVATLVLVAAARGERVRG